MIYIIIILSILLILVLTYIYLENYSIKITRHNIKSDKVDGKFKIIHISDFHNERNKWLHKQVVNHIKKEKPNIIVITGDLIDTYKNEYAKVLIDEITPLAPVYYVSGNHEYEHGGYNRLKKILLKYKVNILENESMELNNNICLYGIKDPKFEEKEDEYSVVKEWLDNFNIKTNKYNILLTHRPEQFDLYTEYSFNLVFSGHAHGGQFIIPLIGPLFAPHQGIRPKYAMGKHKKRNTSMIVSRGVGNSLFARIRINNRPELIVVSLSNK
jgi:predicted MPP superfamily phosphohydrolase